MIIRAMDELSASEALLWYLSYGDERGFYTTMAMDQMHAVYSSQLLLQPTQRFVLEQNSEIPSKRLLASADTP